MKKLGVQIVPWRPSKDLLAVGERFSKVVDVVWVQDQMLARNVYALLAALASRGCGVGTNVTYPVARNPIEMASAAATISELLDDGRELMLGMGIGGALVKSLFTTDKSIAGMRESLQLMRSLWSAAAVNLDDYPVLGAKLGYRAGATAQLTYPVARPPAIVLAGVGPKILRVAAELGDGIISASNMPTQSISAFRTGRYGEHSGLDAARAARPDFLPPLRLVFGINVSVAADRAAARHYARRQLTLVLGNPALWPALDAVGIDVDSAAEVKAAFDAGLGIDGAAARMSDSLCDALMVAGTPDDCVAGIAELHDRASAEGYTEFYLGAPLGPDLDEAATLLCDEVIPQVWPERLVGHR